MEKYATGRHRRSLAVELTASLVLLASTLTIIGVGDQLLTTHGARVGVGVIVGVISVLIVVGALRTKASKARACIIVLSAISIAASFVVALGATPLPSITFTAQQERNICGSYLIQKLPEELPPPPGTRAELPQWASDQGGIDANNYGTIGYITKVLVTIRGTSSNEVRVTGLHLSAAKRVNGGLKGSIVSGECGGETVARYAEVDLDRDPPAIIGSSSTIAMWGDTQERTTPLMFPYTVSDKSTESILIIAHTHNYVAWTGSLSWTDGQNSGTETIDAGGRPFETTAAASGSSVVSDSTGQWTVE